MCVHSRADEQVAQPSAQVTASQLVQRIREKTAAVPPATDDIVGDLATAITGIATVAIASLDCLRRAAAARLNLVVTLEPAFWGYDGDPSRLEGDAVFQAKRDFIRDNHLVCFHLRGRWPADGPDGIAVGMANQLGWKAFVDHDGDPASFTLPPTTLLGLARELTAKLGDRTLRVVGDPALPVRRVAAKWGTASRLPAIHLLNGPADVLLVGYAHEWEAVEYAQDMISAGDRKGLILLGEVKSEDAGMRYCAEWLKTFIPEMPVQHLPAAEPFWNLHHPGYDASSARAAGKRSS